MNTSGIGLGLFICKQIVEQFNGLIHVESQLSEGSNFMFNFDLEDQVAVGDHSSSESEEPQYEDNEVSTFGQSQDKEFLQVNI